MYAFLLPSILILIVVIAVAESSTANGAAAIGFTEPMEDESDVLTPEVVAKVDANWFLAIQATMIREYELDVKRFKCGNMIDFLCEILCIRKIYKVNTSKILMSVNS